MNVPTANIAADAPVLLRENAPKYRYASAFMIENLIARDAEEGFKMGRPLGWTIITAVFGAWRRYVDTDNTKKIGGDIATIQKASSVAA